MANIVIIYGLTGQKKCNKAYEFKLNRPKQAVLVAHSSLHVPLNFCSKELLALEQSFNMGFHPVLKGSDLLGTQ